MKIEKQVSSLLIELGYPKFFSDKNFLHALHAGASFHRLAVIFDVVKNYIDSVGFEGFELDYYQLLHTEAQCDYPYQAAMFYYKQAFSLNSNSAEALYGIARIQHQNKEFDSALDSYKHALILDPHPEAPPEAQLHANSHWHLATIFEELKDDSLALSHYRQAIFKCSYFGVHHKRYADILRRLGYVEEAIPEYEKMMTYGHRYFTEFVLPPLNKTTKTSSSDILDIIYKTSDGYPVVFWDNLYYKVYQKNLLVSSKALTAMRELQCTHLKKNMLKSLSKKLVFWRQKKLFNSSVSIMGLEVEGN